MIESELSILSEGGGVDGISSSVGGAELAGGGVSSIGSLTGPVELAGGGVDSPLGSVGDCSAATSSLMVLTKDRRSFLNFVCSWSVATSFWLNSLRAVLIVRTGVSLSPGVRSLSES